MRVSFVSRQVYQRLCVNNRYFSACVLLRPGVPALLMLLVTGMPVAGNGCVCALVLLVTGMSIPPLMITGVLVALLMIAGMLSMLLCYR